MGRNFIWPDLPSALNERQPWGTAGIEPPLCDVLDDPLVHAVMRRDRITAAELKRVIASAQRRLRPAPSPCLAA